MYNRRKGLAVILATILLNLACIRPEAAGIQLAIDLAGEGRQAEQACIPLLLEFAAEHCPSWKRKSSIRHYSIVTTSNAC